jgi:N-glycosidase YbiA
MRDENELGPESASVDTPAALIIPDDNRILYFARDRQAGRFLSHFWPSVIELDGETWPDVEHYYQAQKSDSVAYRNAIRAAQTPGHAKRLSAAPDARGKAGKQSWFRANGKEPRPDWNEVKLDIMRRADWAKFSQNPDLAALLLATGDAELVEDSPSDAFWGTGRDGTGENWAGRVIMEIRERLRT